MQGITAIIAVVALLVGATAGYLVRRYWAAQQFGTVEEKIKKDLADAEAKAKEIVVEAKGRLVWAEAGGRAGLRFIVIEPAIFVQLQHWTNKKMKDEGWETPS